MMMQPRPKQGIQQTQPTQPIDYQSLQQPQQQPQHSQQQTASYVLKVLITFCKNEMPHNYPYEALLKRLQEHRFDRTLLQNSGDAVKLMLNMYRDYINRDFSMMTGDIRLMSAILLAIVIPVDIVEEAADLTTNDLCGIIKSATQKLSGTMKEYKSMLITTGRFITPMDLGVAPAIPTQPQPAPQTHHTQPQPSPQPRQTSYQSEPRSQPQQPQRPPHNPDRWERNQDRYEDRYTDRYADRQADRYTDRDEDGYTTRRVVIDNQDIQEQPQRNYNFDTNNIEVDRITNRRIRYVDNQNYSEENVQQQVDPDRANWDYEYIGRQNRNNYSRGQGIQGPSNNRYVAKDNDYEE